TKAQPAAARTPAAQCESTERGATKTQLLPPTSVPGSTSSLRDHRRTQMTARRRRPELVLAFPVLDRWSGPREHDVFILDVLGENLSGVEVLNDLAADHRGA